MEKLFGKKTVVIVLGNRLNDDGTITDIQEDRLKMAFELEEMINPSYFILSGGLANPKAGLTEAEAMYNYLVNNGMNKEKLVMEKDSLSTVGNAKYSIPIARELGAELIIVCTSKYHFQNPIYKAMESFVSEIENSDLILMTYTR